MAPARTKKRTADCWGWHIPDQHVDEYRAERAAAGIQKATRSLDLETPFQFQFLRKRGLPISPAQPSRSTPKPKAKPRPVPRIEAQPLQQLDLFEDKSRWPRKPYCSDDKTARWIRTLESAIKRPYIQANPPHLRVWSIFDIDREGGGLAWQDAELPPPSWSAINRENGHAHCVWGLSAPVLVDSPDMRQGPLKYLCAVESAFRECLQSDPGFAGLMTKNPAHPLWEVLRGPQMAFSLAELASVVALPKHLPKGRAKVEEIGLGRNVTLFDWLRFYAYKQIRHYKGEVRNFVHWQSHLNVRALERNGDFDYPLDGKEVWHVAHSVSKWVWRRFDLEASDRRFSERQAALGRRGGVAKGMAYEARRADARLMRASGMTQAQIALELGVSERSVRSWLRD